MVNLAPVRGRGVDGLTSWKSLSSLLDESNGCDSTTDSLSPVLVSPSLLEDLDSFVEDESSLIFLVNADEESLEVE